MVVFRKFEPLMRLSVEGQDSSWILWHWRTDIRESHYMWKDLEISSLYLSALGTTFLYHCAGGASQLRCQNLKEGWNTSASLGYPQGQYLLCTGPRSSFCCSCCCTAAWLGYIWFSSLEKRSHGCWGTRSLKDWWKPHPRPPDLQMFCSLFPLTSVILF